MQSCIAAHNSEKEKHCLQPKGIPSQSLEEAEEFTIFYQTQKFEFPSPLPVSSIAAAT